MVIKRNFNGWLPKQVATRGISSEMGIGVLTEIRSHLSRRTVQLSRNVISTCRDPGASEGRELGGNFVHCIVFSFDGAFFRVERHTLPASREGGSRMYWAVRLATNREEWYSRIRLKWPYGAGPLLASLWVCGNDNRFSTWCSLYGAGPFPLRTWKRGPLRPLMRALASCSHTRCLN